MVNEQLVDIEDIINTYREEGKIKSYNYAVRYLKFSKLKGIQSVQDLFKRLKLPIRTISHWTKGERTPFIIQIINDLKNKRCLPLFPSEKLARIVGYIHGDGWITTDLRTVGFSSSEKTLLENIQNNLYTIFCSKGQIERTIRSGEKVIILGKERTARKTGYRLQVFNTGIARCLYLVSGIKGKKMKLVKRSMVKEPKKGYLHWYKYTPNKRKIKHFLKNELMLLDILPGIYYKNQRLHYD